MFTYIRTFRGFIFYTFANNRPYVANPKQLFVGVFYHRFTVEVDFRTTMINIATFLTMALVYLLPTMKIYTKDTYMICTWPL